MTIEEQRYYETIIRCLPKISKNLEDINETLKVIAVQINEKGGKK